MIAALIVLGLVAGVLLVMLERAYRRAEAERDRVAAGFERERAEWTRERQLLLNRIKPETAQYVAPTDPVVLPAPVRFDDDEGYWAATESKEDLAERMLREELKARVSEDAGGPA